MTSDNSSGVLSFQLESATLCVECTASNVSDNLDGQLDGAIAGSRGYADLDSTSATACQSCPSGTFSTGDGLQECMDFDECASLPCENGAGCMHPILSGTGVVAGSDTAAADFTCQCVNGFVGEICDLLDECLLNPCVLNAAMHPSGVEAVGDGNRFLCPVT
eukprot:COSAG05_NODE_6030_length_1038_cov_11.218118_3_plen_161_part_01